MIPSANAPNLAPTPPPVSTVPAPVAATQAVVPTAVTPTISIASSSNNARGNNGLLGIGASTAGAPPPASQPAPASNARAAAILQANGLTTSDTNGFLAQLISQDLSPESRSVLVQYEKLVYFSTIKYKPSDAQKPEAVPADLFSRIVNEKRSQSPTAGALASRILAESADSEGAAVSIATQTASTPQSSRPRPTLAQEIEAEESALAAILDSTPAPAVAAAPAALVAYISSANRVRVETPIEASTLLA